MSKVTVKKISDKEYEVRVASGDGSLNINECLDAIFKRKDVEQIANARVMLLAKGPHYYYPVGLLPPQYIHVRIAFNDGYSDVSVKGDQIVALSKLGTKEDREKDGYWMWKVGENCQKIEVDVKNQSLQIIL